VTLDADWDRALERTMVRFRRELDAVAASARLDPGERAALVQEVRIRLWRAARSPENLDGIGPSFLYRAAKWAALDLLRSRRRTQMDTEAALREGPRAVAAERSDTFVVRAAIGGAVERGVEGLAPDRRTAVSLWLSGYSWKEVAALTGWSETRTRNLLYRGLDDLRAALRGMGFGPGVSEGSREE
jgi:RNA polymerase sigma-70 factor, ECF subfamily